MFYLYTSTPICASTRFKSGKCFNFINFGEEFYYKIVSSWCLLLRGQNRKFQLFFMDEQEFVVQNISLFERNWFYLFFDVTQKQISVDTWNFQQILL